MPPETQLVRAASDTHVRARPAMFAYSLVVAPGGGSKVLQMRRTGVASKREW